MESQSGSATRFLRLPAVLARLGVSRSTLYRMVAAEAFPRPVRLSPHTSAWPESELEAFCARRAAARFDEAA